MKPEKTDRTEFVKDAMIGMTDAEVQQVANRLGTQFGTTFLERALGYCRGNLCPWCGVVCWTEERGNIHNTVVCQTKGR
jgi:hypothetical protein